ncbi:MAG: hypothetical protein WAU70_03240 [Flavobacteriales bacterium]
MDQALDSWVVRRCAASNGYGPAQFTPGPTSWWCTQQRARCRDKPFELAIVQTLLQYLKAVVVPEPSGGGSFTVDGKSRSA